MRGRHHRGCKMRRRIIAPVLKTACYLVRRCFFPAKQIHNNSLTEKIAALTLPKVGSELHVYYSRVFWKVGGRKVNSTREDAINLLAEL